MAYGPAIISKAMRSAIALLPTLLISLSVHAFAGPPSGTQIIRVENVGLEALGYPELATGTSIAGERLVRIVALAENGRYLVAVRSNIGILRMKGAYLDSTLTIEDGNFIFYYANGRTESEGRYVHGSKSGTWLRYAMDGAPLAERNYTGLNKEKLLTSMGVIEQVNLGEATRPAAIAGPAPRRSGKPVVF